MVSFATPRHHDGLPAVDDRLVEPEQHAEVFDGVLVPVSPAREPHGERQFLVCTLLGPYLAPGFTAAVDMLTRVSRDSDVAPDISVYPKARDPATGGRQLEHLVFEIVNTESRSHAGRRAVKLITRGVHRVFAIDVVRNLALEWSSALAAWTQLAPDAVIEHPAFITPVPMEALVQAVIADDHVARVLLTKRNPVFEAARAQDREDGFRSGLQLGKAEGLQLGRANSVVAVLTARGWSLDDTTRAQIFAERDLERLDRWVVRALSCASVADLFATP
jgi:Uma2 family endonuclease